MSNRREFICNSAMGAGALMLPGALLSTSASAQTAGNMSPASWAGASDPTLLQQVWGIRFSNTLPWALDPTNAVLATALNVDAAGNVPVLNKTLKPNLPAVGFIMKPDTGTTNVYSIKAGQTPWPMLGPLGGKFADGTAIPVTTLWGYGNHDLEQIFVGGGGLGVTFPARSFIVQRGSPINVNWYNNLVDGSGNPLPHLVGVDQTIAMQANGAGAPINGVPIAVHHHGGNNLAEFDGGPDQWFTPKRLQVGPGIFDGKNTAANSDHLTYQYKNDDEASLHWYHDHGDGVTRINAYAGLAGLYVIRDANEAALIKAKLLPTGEQELPIVIQDKIFQANGGIAYTGDSPALNGWNSVDPASVKQLPTFTLPALPGFTPPAYNPNDPLTVVTGTQPTHVPEMFGDVICVNGVAWPSAKVERRQYRLRLLNGSDSRVYNLNFGGLSFYQVGTDVGLLNKPVLLTTITIFPGERKDIVIDFSQASWKTKIVVTNDAAFPYPTGTPTLAADPWATIMQFDVSKQLNEKVNQKTQLKSETVLRGLDAATPVMPILTSAPRNLVTRKIMLGEGCDDYGRITPLLGTVADGTKLFHDGPDIFPKLGATEVWEFWNTTVDSHPIHMHLVRFRIAERQKFTGAVQATVLSNGWAGVKFSAPPVLSGRASPAPLSEQGWKDTVVCPPGYVTRVVTTFNFTGKFVYHCHILGHEEHDMMRWFQVV
jgi:spore coat protein A